MHTYRDLWHVCLLAVFHMQFYSYEYVCASNVHEDAFAPMYVFAYVCVMYLFMYVNVLISMNLCNCFNDHIITAHVYGMHACVCVCVCVSVFVCVCVYVCVCINGHIKFILNLTLSQPNARARKFAIGEYIQTQLSYLSHYV